MTTFQSKLSAPTVTADGRIPALDYIRAIACFMVIIVHSCEFYYLGADGVSFAQQSDRLWVTLFDSFTRQSVPLYVMISAFLLLPIKTDTSTFFRRRFSRILCPFVIWSLLYAALPVLFGQIDGSISERVIRVFYTFNYDAGHLWYMYMFIGIYLIAPVISPWLAKATKREEQLFLMLWFISCFYIYLSPKFGLPWGEALWNEQHTLYYFSGFIGYVVLAHYVRVHMHWSLKRSLAVGLPLIVVGYAITAVPFYTHTLVSDDYALAEQSWYFCSFNVAMMTLGTFMILRHINYSAKWLYAPIRAISRWSFGIYLMHIFFLNVVYAWLSPLMSTPLAIMSVTIVTFAVCCAVSRILSYLPGSKYILG